MKTATDFPDPGMLDQLRELSDPEHFEPFTIRMQDGTKFSITKAQDIEFTPFGSPKVYSLSKHGSSKQWYILNVDAIVSISLGKSRL